MAGRSRRALLGMCYTPDERDRFHRDLRVDYELTQTNGRKSPGVLAAHADCETCARIRGVGGES